MAIKKLKNTSNISSTLTGNNTGHYWGPCGNIGGSGISGTTTTTTTTGGNPYWINTPLIANPGQVITTGGNNTISWTDGISMNSDIIEYIDIFYQLMGIDMDYNRFSIMSKEEKRSFIRDIKLQKLIDEK
jgi:hypothetical protein